jgi:hypothetical protein
MTDNKLYRRLGIHESQYKPIITGSIAGAIGYVGTLPLDMIKQHLQSNPDARMVYKNISNNVKSEGFRYLFRGGLLGCYSIVPQMAIKFTCNDYLSKNTKNSSFTNGFISGYVDGSFLGPILSVTSLQQMKKEFGYRESLRILRSVPILPLTIPLAFRNATYTSVLFGGHKTVINLKKEKEEDRERAKEKTTRVATFFNNFVITSFLNVPGVLLCSPFDVIRAHQIDNMINHRPNGPLYIAKLIFMNNGLKGFYQGIGSLYINFALRFPITFSIFYALN